MNPADTPPLDAHMVAWLNEKYPERCPDPRDTDREIWMKAGERRLVKHLQHLLQQQEQDLVST